jgi:hypothetical protein
MLNFKEWFVTNEARFKGLKRLFEKVALKAFVGTKNGLPMMAV